MVTRRDVASIVGLGAIGAATASALASPAVAQAADPNESTFARIRRTKKMRIGAVGGGAPYYMKDLSSGQWKGFYVDIAKALADDMEAELEITETTWGNSVLDLQSNKIDIFFGLNPTPKRALVDRLLGAGLQQRLRHPLQEGLQAEELGRAELARRQDRRRPGLVARPGRQPPDAEGADHRG